MELLSLMQMATARNIEGYIDSDRDFKFKTEKGWLYTWNKVTKEWIRPHITSAWFSHKFVVESWTKIKDGDDEIGENCNGSCSRG